jgi:hypothetical protein
MFGDTSTPAQESNLAQNRDIGDNSSRLFDELDGGYQGSASCQHVIDQ